MVLGGCQNGLSGGNNNLIGGGCSNCILTSSCSFIGGGSSNCIIGFSYGVIAGGFNNTVCALNGVIGGGCANSVCGLSSTVAGGCLNVNRGQESGMLTGRNNLIASGVTGAILVGGYCSWNCTHYGFIGTGQYQTLTNAAIGPSGAVGSVIVGGMGNNTCGGTADLVYGCFTNNPFKMDTGKLTFIGGGLQNRTSGCFSSIVGGACNVTSGCYGFIGGGTGNSVAGSFSTVSGGRTNCVCSGTTGSAILGGFNNTVSASYAGVFGCGLTNGTTASFMANCLKASNLSIGAICSDSSGLIINPTSDCRIKQCVSPIGYGLNEINCLNPVSFYWRDDCQQSLGSDQQIGFIAQEAKSVIPQTVFLTTSGYYGFNVDRIIPVLTKAVQELKSCNDSLKSEIDAIKQRLQNNGIN